MEINIPKFFKTIFCVYFINKYFLQRSASAPVVWCFHVPLGALCLFKHFCGACRDCELIKLMKTSSRIWWR